MVHLEDLSLLQVEIWRSQPDIWVRTPRGPNGNADWGVTSSRGVLKLYVLPLINITKQLPTTCQLLRVNVFVMITFG